MRLTCVVDNAAQSGSGLWAEHGLAYLIETGGRQVLFDTGQSGTVLLHNLLLLGFNPTGIAAVAVSHAHYDHTGGLPALIPYTQPGTPLFANADLFRDRFGRRDGQVKRIGLPLSEPELAARFQLHLSDAPQEVAPGVWTTGRVSERPEFEGRSQNHLMAVEGELLPDAYQDDMALVLAAGERVALLCGCCHAGLLNTLAHVARAFPQPITLIAGGLHLAGVAEADLRHAGAVLAAMPSLQQLYPGHCTGEHAVVALTQQLGASVVSPAPVGTVIEFD